MAEKKWLIVFFVVGKKKNREKGVYLMRKVMDYKNTSGVLVNSIWTILGCQKSELEECNDQHPTNVSNFTKTPR